MIGKLLEILGLKTKVDFKALVAAGASIVDVRTKQEFQSGHIKGSVNIPLDKLGSEISKLKKNKPVITVCASGMRSGAAKGMLKSKGFECYNGGSWYSLNQKI
jgi:phage shock protein E